LRARAGCATTAAIQQWPRALSSPTGRRLTINGYQSCVGPYCLHFAEDQLASIAQQLNEGARQLNANTDALRQIAEIGKSASQDSLVLLRRGDPTHVYWTLLGTEFPFEHTTTADKFLYEAELRTGLGAHYRYAQHLRHVLALWYQRFPETKSLVLEGSAEPE
jgi:hypothetical protein